MKSAVIARIINVSGSGSVLYINDMKKQPQPDEPVRKRPVLLSAMIINVIRRVFGTVRVLLLIWLISKAMVTPA